MKTPRKRTTTTGTTADTSTARKRSARKSGDTGEVGEMRDGGADGRSTRPESSAPRTDDMPRSDAEIRERAYHIYLARGGTPGGALDDWLQAEREQREEQQRGTTRSGQRPHSSPPNQ